MTLQEQLKALSNRLNNPAFNTFFERAQRAEQAEKQAMQIKQQTEAKA